MEANGKLEDIINWESCYADEQDSLPQVSLYGLTPLTAPRSSKSLLKWEADGRLTQTHCVGLEKEGEKNS